SRQTLRGRGDQRQTVGTRRRIASPTLPGSAETAASRALGAANNELFGLWKGSGGATVMPQKKKSLRSKRRASTSRKPPREQATDPRHLLRLAHREPILRIRRPLGRDPARDAPPLDRIQRQLRAKRRLFGPDVEDSAGERRDSRAEGEDRKPGFRVARAIPARVAS